MTLFVSIDLSDLDEEQELVVRGALQEIEEEIGAENISQRDMDEIPEILQGELEIIVKNENDEPEVLNLGEVLSSLLAPSENREGVLVYLLKVRQSICNLAYSMEEYYNRTDDTFRVWRSNLERTLNYTDDRNPLVAEGSKTTVNAIEAYTRSQPEYKEFKQKLSEIYSSKQSLWSAKTTIDMAISIASGRELLGGVDNP